MIESKFMYKLSRWLLASALTVGMSWPAAALQISAAPGSGGGSGGITIGQAVTGGTPSTLIYNDSGGLLANSKTIPFGIVITPAVNTNALAVTGASLTGTDTHSLMDLAGTLNNGTTNVDVLALRATITATGTATNLLNLYGGAAGTTSVFKVDKNGETTASLIKIGDYVGAYPAIYGTPYSTSLPIILGNSVGVVQLPVGILNLGGSAGTLNAVLTTDAANTLAQRNGANAQTLRVYGTWTDTSNGDWLSLTKAAGGAATISTVANGTGTAGNLVLSPGSKILSVTGAVAIGGVVPTLALAGGTCAGTVIAGGSTAGTVTLTGACVATNTLTLSVMPTAPTGYSCDAVDRTLGVSDLGETSTSTTTAVFTFGGTTGATDVIQYKCMAY